MKKYILILAAALSLTACSLKEQLISNSRGEDFYKNAV